MSQNFSALSQGLISYLASRPHDWTAWQMEENEVHLKLTLLGGGNWVEKTFPLSASPSKSLEESLKDLKASHSANAGPKVERLPPPSYALARNSEGLGSGEME